MPHPGCGTLEGTSSFRDSFSGKADPAHFRKMGGLWMSSVGIGTYLGEADEATDAAYRESVAGAVRSGINVIDTAINYRFQRSERSIARALDALFASGEVRREQLVLSTKGGFIPFEGAAPASPDAYAAYMRETYFEPGHCAPPDIAGGCHCMTPAYLRHELDRSLANLGVEKVDIYYLHNPETQLPEVARPVFLERLRAAFEEMERAVAAGKIGCYGTATWNGYRAAPEAGEYLSLDEVWAAAEAAGGKDHHFRVVQLPMNLGMTEAFSLPNQRSRGEAVSFLAAAARRGLTVMASGSILQGAAARGLPPVLGEVFPGLRTDAQRALQFTRSTPGIGVALVGMRQPDHVRENAGVAAQPPAEFDTFMKLFRSE